jgi:hypothetical protein
LGDAGHRRFYFEEKKDVERMFDQADTTVDFLKLFFDKWIRGSKKKRWAEKTPNNIFTAEKILDAYPDGRFINVIRDGRDVLLSLNQRRGTHAYVGIFRWLAATRAGVSLWGNRRVMQVKYEDLVMRTEHTLETICAFIGEDYDKSMLDYWKMKLPEDIESPDNPTQDYGKQPVFTDSIGKWKKDGIDRTILAQMDLTIKERLGDLGYNEQ